jgi:phosphate transport system protein
MERRFDGELWDLKKKLLEMADHVQRMTGLSIRSLEERRAGENPLVHDIEKRVNGLQMEIEKEVLKLLALRQPTAGDLRFLLGALKIANDLERVGDQACNVAETTAYLLREPALAQPPAGIPCIAELAQNMIRDSIEAFVTHDAALAEQVMKSDDAVDRLKENLFSELLTRMNAEPAAVMRGVDLILVSRNLERIADHATNIAEEVIFIEKGENAKHHLNISDARSIA